MKLPSIVLTIGDKDGQQVVAEFDVSKYMTEQAAVLRGKAAYAINILRSHQEILDRLVEQGAEGTARGIRNDEKYKGATNANS